MRTNYINIQLIGLFMLSMIPWPGPTIFKISCPRDNARIVRKIIQSKWIPVLEKYKVNLPLQCPFHPQRDIFGPQQAAKHQHRPSQWTCGFCGKSFFEERFLDMHFDNRHKSNVNMAEDAVCLADYCDIMRCNVLITQDAKIAFPESINTDIEIWREGTAYRTALATSSSRELAPYTTREKYVQKQSPVSSTAQEKPLKHCEKKDAPESEENSEDSTDDKSQNGSKTSCQSDLVDSALPAADFKQQKLLELQKLKANCKPDELQKLKVRCEILIRDCIASLLIQLSINEFKEIEDELNKAVCWYLTCDRYWEDSQTDNRLFPWGLLFMIVMVLSLGICLCYYIIWVLFDSDDISVTSASMTDTSTPSPAHTLRGQSSTTSNSLDVPTPNQQIYTEDYYATSDKDVGQNEHYIYVTYPPDLKRRLMERGCLDGLGFAPAAPNIPRDNPIQLDTAYMGYEVVIVKGGQRVCGSGGALGNAPLVQSKSYFEVKIQQGGSWGIGLATRQTNLSLTQGGMDEFSWALCSDNVIRHNKQELHRLNSNTNTPDIQICEGDIVGVSYDHIQLKFYANGKELDCPVTNVKGTVFPALYVDEGAILDIVLENFSYPIPAGFEKIMLEQSLL